ncbi:ABC transporter permease [Paenibacillus frigoriresistens]|uniref:ABC transporter permease n=1 Tax=Paenibacillus alginolyticus TaxID=59839 RepID=UPI0015671D57|nr:ABC transporter permease [Paenibacillus frigoriresistens]NRF95750.1 ABC transporter permease [Paenibacillus frigoriresistens]
MEQYIKNFMRYTHLLKELVARDLKIKYRRSILGYFWSLLNPFLMMLVLTLIFSNLFKFDIPNYPMYLLSGQLLFTFFSEATSLAMTSIYSNASLLQKVYIPKYIFPLSKVCSSLINLLFSMGAIIIMLCITEVKVTVTILMFPLPILYLFLFSLGMGMILSVIAVFFRDMLHIYSILLTAWMYFTPLFYPLNIVPDYLKGVINYNPMYYYVEYFREIILYGTLPSAQLNLICCLTGVITLITGMFIFYKNQNKFILYI